MAAHRHHDDPTSRLHVGGKVATVADGSRVVAHGFRKSNHSVVEVARLVPRKNAVTNLVVIADGVSVRRVGCRKVPEGMSSLRPLQWSEKFASSMSEH